MREYHNYDKKNFKYEKEEKNIQYWTWRITKYLFLSGSVSMIIIYFVLNYYITEEAATIRNSNLKLEGLYVENRDSLTSYKEKLAFLRAKNKELHKLILNAELKEDSIDNVKANQLADDANLSEIEKELKSLKDKINNQSTSQNILYELGTIKKDQLKRIPAIRPVFSEIISGYGKRKHPIQKKDYEHDGIDFKADKGTEVKATGNGVVIEIGTRDNGQGTFILIDHGHGYVSKYAHLSKVSVGRYSQVKRGQVIGLSGMSGLAKGPHLHYEVIKNGKNVDPIDYRIISYI